MRRATVDANLKTVTLIAATMVDQDGNVLPLTVQQDTVTRRWAELEANTQKALTDATAVVTKQMAKYNDRLASAPEGGAG